MNRKICFSEIVIVFAIDLIIFGTLILYTGSLWSGFHLVDDHTVLSISEMLRGMSIIDVAKALTISELGARFRPFYNILLAVKTAFVGVDMFWWMLISLIEGIASYIMLYAAVRYLGLNYFESFFFATLILIGEQITPWYRALNQENTGVFILSILFFILCYAFCGENKGLQKKAVFRFVVIFLAIILSLQKEAFVLLLPFWWLFIIYLEVSFSNLEIKTAVKKNVDYLVVLVCVSLAEIILIMTVSSGGAATGYAGFSSSVAMKTYIKGIITSVRKSLWIYLILMLVGIVLGFGLYKRAIKKADIILILISIGVMGSQLVLHARSRMWERYMHPFIWAWALFSLVFIFRILRNRKWAYYIYLFSCIVALGFASKSAYEHASKWANDGVQAKNLLCNIEELSSEDKLLTNTSWMEWNLAIAIYLNYYYPDGHVSITQVEELGDTEEIDYSLYDVVLVEKKEWKSVSDDVKEQFELVDSYKISTKKLYYLKKIQRN